MSYEKSRQLFNVKNSGLPCNEIIFNSMKSIVDSIGPISVRMSLEQLLDIQMLLDSELFGEKITYVEWVEAWDAVLIAAGWDQIQYEKAIDDRWDMMDILSKIPEKFVTSN